MDADMLCIEEEDASMLLERDELIVDVDEDGETSWELDATTILLDDIGGVTVLATKEELEETMLDIELRDEQEP